MKLHLYAAAALFGFVPLAGAQTPGSSRPATLDDVVAEVRALRADMLRMQEASVRAQLLVAKLQVQEQRTASVARDLAQTEEQIRGLEAARNPFAEAMLRDLSKAPAKPEEAEFAAILKAQLEKLQNGDPVLKERRDSLTQLLAEEQARWAAFNTQLAALEQELAAVKKR